MNLPFFDLKRQYVELQDEIGDALQRVSQSGMYIGGDELVAFEQEAASYTSVRFGCGLSSGTDALLATLMALDVGSGDEVVTTPFTFIATAEVISFLGARPVFVDVLEDTFNMDPNLLEAAINERTRCIIPVHLFGQMADMERIMGIAGKHGIPVVEDAAQAIGASIGGKKACSFGVAGCLSFFPSKNLGAFGDGGMVLTDSEKLHRAIAVIKNHGSEVRYHHTRIGINGRLDAIQAAILRVKLRHLDTWAALRREHAGAYTERLSKYVTVPVSRDGYGHVFNQYTIRTGGRDELAAHLRERGVPSAIYYPIPLHLQEVFAGLGYRKGDFPVSEKLCEEVLSLPVFPEMTGEERDFVVESVISFFER
jgi:dTDP-4-amino-4,6-dideoxygalactose transaminase